MRVGGGVQNTMGVQITIQGGSIFNKGVQYTMDVNRPRVQFTMGFKIPYDTGIFLGKYPGNDGKSEKNEELVKKIPLSIRRQHSDIRWNYVVNPCTSMSGGNVWAFS